MERVCPERISPLIELSMRLTGSLMVRFPPGPHLSIASKVDFSFNQGGNRDLKPSQSLMAHAV
jgi:hypothetical protein